MCEQMPGHAAAVPSMSVHPSAYMNPANQPDVLWQRPVSRQMSFSDEVPLRAQHALTAASGLQG